MVKSQDLFFRGVGRALAISGCAGLKSSLAIPLEMLRQIPSRRNYITPGGHGRIGLQRKRFVPPNSILGASAAVLQQGVAAAILCYGHNARLMVNEFGREINHIS